MTKKTTGLSLKTPLAVLSYAARPYRSELLLMLALIFLGQGLSYSAPYFLKLITEVATGTPGSFTPFLLPFAGLIAVLFSAEISWRIAHWLENRTSIFVFERVTTSLYHFLLDRSSRYFEDRFSGEIGRRVEQVGTAIHFFVDSFPWEISWILVGAGMTGVLLSLSHQYLVWAYLLWLTYFVCVSYPLLRWHYKEVERVAEAQAELSGTTIDVLGNIGLVQSFAAHGHEHHHYGISMGVVVAAQQRANRAMLFNKFHQGSSVALLGISLVGVGIYLLVRGEIALGDFVIIATALPTLSGVIWTAGDLVTQAIRNYGEFKNAITSLALEADDVPEGDKALVVKSPDVSFEAVSFSYPGREEEVLTDFTLEVKAGEKVGLVGRSGAGKSTIVKLLLRQYDVSAGVVSIDGQDVRTVSLSSLRDSISLVPQDTALFHRSLYENILYARPEASESDVFAASKQAHAHEFIEQYPLGYDTRVGERGVKLSGGQRQRVALARAMLKNAPILILDEATSALDSESEEIVQHSLQELFEGRTVIAIAHRLSTLRAMDRIVVVEDGRIVEDGSPTTLLRKRNGIFKTLWKHQKGGFV